MNAARFTLVALILSAVVLGGCTTTQSGTGTGAGIGAAIGALAGQAIGRDTTGTAIGAGAGAVAGAITGGLIGQAKQQKATEARLGRLESQNAARSQQGTRQGSAVTSSNNFRSDPTAGQLVNSTDWIVQVFIDREPAGGASPTVTMNAGETRPLNLDIGQHRVVATALVQTQFGQRKVGRYDQMINVDARQSGFRVLFSTNSFQ